MQPIRSQYCLRVLTIKTLVNGSMFIVYVIMDEKQLYLWPRVVIDKEKMALLSVKLR